MTALLVEGEELSADLRDAIEHAEVVARLDRTSRVTLTLRDPHSRIMRSRLLQERTRLTVDGRVYELASVARQAQNTVVPTFEAALAADLRRRTGPLTAAAGTVTRGEFIARLASDIGYADLDIYPGETTRIQLARDDAENSWQAIRRLASEVGWRAFVADRTLVVGPDDWLAERSEPTPLSQELAAVDRIEWSIDVRDPDEAEATVEVHTDRWRLDAGQPVVLSGQGLADGVWIIREVAGSLFRTARTVALVRRQPDLPEPEAPPPPADHGADGLEGMLDALSPIAGQQPPTRSADGWVWPVRGRITSGFGPRRSPGGVGSTNHQGIDIAAPTGTPIRAARDGTVEFAGFAGGYGFAVYLRHTGVSRGIGHRQTRYAHMVREPSVQRGQQVRQGQILGNVGCTGSCTGPHLHFEVRTAQAAIDPLRVLPSL